MSLIKEKKILANKLYKEYGEKWFFFALLLNKELEMEEKEEKRIALIAAYLGSWFIIGYKKGQEEKKEEEK